VSARPDFDRDDRPSTAQPPPVFVPGGESVHSLVIAELRAVGTPLGEMLAERRAFGLRKYGQPLQVEDPARDPAQDLLEELGDALVYAYRARARGVRFAGTAYGVLAWLSKRAARRWYRPGE
jgi:hypothetical protein